MRGCHSIVGHVPQHHRCTTGTLQGIAGEKVDQQGVGATGPEVLQSASSDGCAWGIGVYFALQFGGEVATAIAMSSREAAGAAMTEVTLSAAPSAVLSL